jgi:hypothetical protein
MREDAHKEMHWPVPERDTVGRGKMTCETHEYKMV